MDIDWGFMLSFFQLKLIFEVGNVSCKQPAI